VKEHRSASDSEIPDPETWVDNYGDYLYRYAFSITRDPAIAEDVVQETFLAALEAQKNFRGRSSVRTWLTGILKHKVLDHLRRKSREKQIEDPEELTASMDALFDGKNRWKVQPTKWALNPMKLLEQKEFWKAFGRCLSELPTRMAQAFMLREMDGLRSEEICKVLSISATNYWVILYRARMYLRRCLEINWFDTQTPED
jgi:RNA polymerase sigma-70 factor (ECF subfamily)